MLPNIGTRSRTTAVAILIAAATVLVPVQKVAAASNPTYADVVYCFGGGNGPHNRDIIEVAAPVVYAFNRRIGVLDKQDVSWRADLLVWNGNAWALVKHGPWAQPYTTVDGDGAAPEFDLAGRVLRGMRWTGFELNRLYTIQITVHWYAVGSLGATESTITPSTFLPMGGGLPFDGQWCDYVPDFGLVDLP